MITLSRCLATFPYNKSPVLWTRTVGPGGHVAGGVGMAGAGGQHSPEGAERGAWLRVARPVISIISNYSLATSTIFYFSRRVVSRGRQFHRSCFEWFTRGAPHELFLGQYNPPVHTDSWIPFIAPEFLLRMYRVSSLERSGFVSVMCLRPFNSLFCVGTNISVEKKFNRFIII